MTGSHFLSNTVLSVAGLGFFWLYFRNQPLYHKLLWSVYILSIVVPAVYELAGGLTNTGHSALPVLHGLRMTLGPVCLIAAIWALIRSERPGPLLLVGSVLAGLAILISLMLSGLLVMIPIVMAFCIVVAMTLASFGLVSRQKSALWVIFSMMLLALSTKSTLLPLPIDPADTGRYLVALSLFCLGKSVYYQSSMLF